MTSNDVEDQAVTNFRNYIRVKTVHPNPDYDGAMVFLSQMAHELDVPYKIIEVAPHKPVFLMTYEGLDPSLPSILLNSHSDVVPVVLDKWKHDPFAAVKDEEGNIYGRGTQDMKCVGMQYIEAIRRIKTEGKRMLRTVHLSFVPDEEIGGELGMNQFVNAREFKDLNVGFALDEGLAKMSDTVTVYNGERANWWIRIKATGNPGHGAQLVQNTAAEKIRRVINRFLEFRESQEQKLKENADLTLGDITTVNLTMIMGGMQVNVVPSEITVCFDMRVAHTNIEEMESMIKSWINDAGDGITYEFIQKWNSTAITSASAENPWWLAFSQALNDLNLKVKCEIFPGATDARYLRKVGIPAFGFSPLPNTPHLAHEHDEFLNEGTFLRGIDIYCHLIPSLANVPKI